MRIQKTTEKVDHICFIFFCLIKIVTQASFHKVYVKKHKKKFCEKMFSKYLDTNALKKANSRVMNVEKRTIFAVFSG